MNKINVVFRACDFVVSVNKSPRPFDLNKTEIIKICFKSLIASIELYPHKITVLGDKLSDELISFFQQYDIQLINGNYGNDESLRQSITIASEFPEDEWVYLCEDDYLHHPDCFKHIITLIKEKDVITFKKRNRFNKNKISEVKPDIVIHPPDYPDRYNVFDNDQSFIFHTSTHHWRQIANTTFTFMLEVSVLKKHFLLLNKSTKNAQDGLLSKMLYGRNEFKNKCICLSPIPGLSNHMHIDTFTPLVDWSVVLNKYR